MWNDGPGGAGTPLWMQLTCSVPRGWDPQEKEYLSFTHFPPSSHGLPRGYRGKESVCNAEDTGDAGSIPELSGRSPARRKWQPTPVFLPGESHGHRILVGYSLWGCNQLDMTECLHVCVCAHTHSLPSS